MNEPGRNSPAFFVALAVCLMMGAFAGTASAQTARSGGGASAQLMQQLQQLGSERTALQAENARMKKELAEMTKERDKLAAARTTLDQRTKASEAAIARSTQGKESAEAENAKLKDRLQELITKFRETAQTLKDVETERATFKQSLAMRDTELSACVDKNTALYKLNGEVLTRLETRGVFSRLATTEPFTRLKRNQLENRVDDYKSRAEDQKVMTSSPQVPPASGAPAPGT